VGGRGKILAQKGIKNQKKKKKDVHGEAFYITGKTDLSFWTMARIIWAEAGWVEERAPFIPEWAAKLIAAFSEVLARLF